MRFQAVFAYVVLFAIGIAALRGSALRGSCAGGDGTRILRDAQTRADPGQRDPVGGRPRTGQFGDDGQPQLWAEEPARGGACGAAGRRPDDLARGVCVQVRARPGARPGGAGDPSRRGFPRELASALDADRRRRPRPRSGLASPGCHRELPPAQRLALLRRRRAAASSLRRSPPSPPMSAGWTTTRALVATPCGPAACCRPTWSRSTTSSLFATPVSMAPARPSCSPRSTTCPNLNDLNKFASKFGLPAFDSLLTVKRNTNWGTPEKPEGETVLDLEIIHAIAPDGQDGRLPLRAGFRPQRPSLRPDGHRPPGLDHLGEPRLVRAGHAERRARRYASIQDRSRALGMSHFVASGDTGAFTCGLDQNPAGSFPSTLPTVTAVGGHDRFRVTGGPLLQGVRVGQPARRERRTGGGASQFYAMPDYQKNEGQAVGHGLRQVPDVSGDGRPADRLPHPLQRSARARPAGPRPRRLCGRRRSP